MSEGRDLVTISLPREVWKEISHASPEMIERLHVLLERNTDGRLTSTERAELRVLIRIAEVCQIISQALQTKRVP